VTHAGPPIVPIVPVAQPIVKPVPAPAAAPGLGGPRWPPRPRQRLPRRRHPGGIAPRCRWRRDRAAGVTGSDAAAGQKPKKPGVKKTTLDDDLAAAARDCPPPPARP
jgi:hypothetical protein